MARDRESCPTDGEDFQIPADESLIAAGWVRRYLADRDRAREAVDLYTSLGYEVKAQELTPNDLGPECDGCASGICDSYLLIYTRARGSGTD